MSENILKKIIKNKIEKIDILKKSVSLDSLKNRINENVDNIDYCLFFIGKSHFILKEFKNSIDVLTQLGSKVDRDDEISFMIAYSHYMNKDYNLSKELFKALSYKSTVYSQYASFYLGMIFLDENDFNLSKNYFYASYKQNNDLNYTKKSLINYEKSIYELGDYELSIAVLNKFKNTYPDDDFSEIDELLSENYFMTNNYSRIISFINSKKNITNSDKIKFQYVTYQKGVNEFNRGNFKSSIIY